MKAVPRVSGKSAARGMSLIELMIAMVLGLIVAGAAVALFATNKLTYTATEDMGRIQESSRVAFELMSRDLRDAGGIPCDSSLAGTMQNGLNSPTANWYTNWDNGLRGYGGATAFTAPVGSAVIGTAQFNRVAGTDAIELKSAEPTDVVVASDVTDANRNAAIPVNNVTGLQLNDLLVVCDYHGGTIFQVTSTPVGTTLVHAGGAGTLGSPGNADGILDLGSYGNDKAGNPVPAMSMNSVIALWRATRWYVGCNARVACTAPGGSSLYQMRVVNTAGTFTTVYDEIASGVTNMNIQYLSNGAAAYVDDESTVASWPAVTAVKVTLTFTGQNRVSSTGAPITRTMQHVVTLRDHLP